MASMSSTARLHTLHPQSTSSTTSTPKDSAAQGRPASVVGKVFEQLMLGWN
jgi:hypothetical protein